MLKSQLISPRITSIASLTIALSLVAVMLSAPASAKQMSSGTWSATTNFKNSGFKCERAGVGFIVCTKGNITYWCSGWKCVRMKSHNASGRPTAGTPGRVFRSQQPRRYRNNWKYIGETEKNLPGGRSGRFRIR